MNNYKTIVGILDYGASNILNVINACEFLGVKVKVVANQNDIKQVTHLILPGVGAFSNGIESLKTITETNETNTILTEYEYGEFVRKVVSEDTEQGRKETIYDENNNITFYENYEFDSDDNILRHEVFNPILEKVALEVRNYKNGNLIDVSYNSIEENHFYTYVYDANNNIIDYKIKDDKDNVLAFEKSVYDDKNREIETISYSMGFQPKHYEIKYEEII